MISIAAGLIRDELRNYIIENKRSDDPINKTDIILDNIAFLENNQANNLDNKVIISIVNIEEESTLKNGSFVVRNPSSNGLAYKEPGVHLNLYILFSATLSGDLIQSYEFALHRVSLVINFFQSKRSFTLQNSLNSQIGNDPSIDDKIKRDLKLIFELYTLTFEQLNHLWGALGGKQVPAVMYKVRLVSISSDERREAPVIEEVNSKDQ